MTLNEQIIRAFADQFTPALPVCKTGAINNIPMRDAWQASFWIKERAIGITAVAHSGGLHAFLEAAGGPEIASDTGQVMAKALGLFQGPSNIERCAKVADDAADAAIALPFDVVSAAQRVTAELIAANIRKLQDQ